VDRDGSDETCGGGPGEHEGDQEVVALHGGSAGEPSLEGDAEEECKKDLDSGPDDPQLLDQLAPVAVESACFGLPANVVAGSGLRLPLICHDGYIPTPAAADPDILAVVVMADRPEVHTAAWPIAAVDIAGLASNLVGAMARLPFRKPWQGLSNTPRNLAVSTTRELTRSLFGYASSLPIDEFRSLERVLDAISGQVLPPFVALQGVRTEKDIVGGVPGLWFWPSRSRGKGVSGSREASESPGTILYLHGGGYIGTSPRMYALFMAHLTRVTGCDLFVADYRLAPEFPFPAAADDIVAVANHLVEGGLATERLILGGDSGGGGLLGTVLHRIRRNSQKRPAAVLMFSPEVSLTLSEDSVTENAPLDILPWNIPVNSYLHGIDPHDDRVDILLDDLSAWPPTFLVYGGDEMFRDAIRTLAEKLEADGVRHEALEIEGMFHVFPFLLPWAHESRDVYRKAGEFVRDALGQG
jgi:epsilon-lactone hydrolase